MDRSKKIISSILSLAIAFSLVSGGITAKASFFDEVLEKIPDWTQLWGAAEGPSLTVDIGNGLGSCTLGGFRTEASIERDYYTTPTSSTEDKYGNVTNYYRGGDTTTTKILDSYNHTFNTIHNTTNNTNNYSANVKLSDFLNSYTTNTNNYTYNTKYNSWYYDQSSQTLNYDASQTYYNTDNSKYYISIDNSTDEYYLVDIQYSPTFVTVNYEYNNIDNSVTNNYGDVTNVYYFELSDGRNSSSLSASEVAGMDLGYDVVNYELIADDPNTLSLQHFDGDYTDRSSYGRAFYSENRSSNYVDSGAFGRAVKLPAGSAAGVYIPGLSDYNNLTFDFRVYFSDIAAIADGIVLGDCSLFSNIPSYKSQVYRDRYSDDGSTYNLGRFCYNCGDRNNCPYLSTLDLPSINGVLDPTEFGYTWSTTISEYHTTPTVDSVGSWLTAYSSLFGWSDGWSEPFVYSSSESKKAYSPVSDASTSKTETIDYSTHSSWEYTTELAHTFGTTYRSTPTSTIAADFSYSSYNNQWVSMRITIKDGQLYYFVNGDLVGAGPFTMPTADKFYIKSAGTLYLDELRISTGDMVSAEVYTPSSEPFDTNKVLALPDVLSGNTIYVRHSLPVTAWRIGGVRPSNPTNGFFYIPLHSDYTAAQAQLYDGSNWVDVDAVVSDGSTTTNTLGFTFNPVSQSPDVDMDAKPGGSGSGDALNCDHAWKCNSRVEATCTVTGQASYACTKCSQTKIETLPLISHSWTVKQTVPTSYDESGNILTEGYTIYRCGICGEEYKDSDGSGPPMVDSSGSSGGSSGDSGWFGELMQKIGDFFGTTVGGLLELIGTAISKLLDSLISLVTMAVEKLTEVLNLFGSFGEALGVLWGWLPEDVVLVLVAGVTVIIFAAVIKLFVR